LSVINIKSKRFEYYDSLNGMSYHEIFKNLKNYLIDEIKDKNYEINLIDLVKNYNSYVPSNKTPQQSNGYDCGVFTCVFANYVSQDKNFDFNQTHITNYFRKKFILNILNKNLN
jgi:sentrin-specific protease 1